MSPGKELGKDWRWLCDPRSRATPSYGLPEREAGLDSLFDRGYVDSRRVPQWVWRVVTLTPSRRPAFSYPSPRFLLLTSKGCQLRPPLSPYPTSNKWEQAQASVAASHAPLARLPKTVYSVVLSNSIKDEVVVLRIHDSCPEKGLKAASQGQDAVICALSSSNILQQIKFANLAIAAGVKWFVPAEWGANKKAAQHGEKLPLHTYCVDSE
ncbi:hypothetical protein FOPE_05985 [Fonsecaea pedrosoi]|nr:hypothetical protein FOPE_05985 [Fonsecaea pedrosoi]